MPIRTDQLPIHKDYPSNISVIVVRPFEFVTWWTLLAHLQALLALHITNKDKMKRTYKASIVSAE